MIEECSVLQEILSPYFSLFLVTLSWVDLPDLIAFTMHFV